MDTLCFWYGCLLSYPGCFWNAKMIQNKPQPQYSNLRKRSLAELDDVIDEIIERNPDFVKKLEKIIEEQKTKNERKNSRTC